MMGLGGLYSHIAAFKLVLLRHEWQTADKAKEIPQINGAHNMQNTTEGTGAERHNGVGPQLDSLFQRQKDLQDRWAKRWNMDEDKGAPKSAHSAVRDAILERLLNPTDEDLVEVDQLASRVVSAFSNLAQQAPGREANDAMEDLSKFVIDVNVERQIKPLLEELIAACLGAQAQDRYNAEMNNQGLRHGKDV
jgi:hypothetical protein